MLKRKRNWPATSTIAAMLMIWFETCVSRR
jgi:hypothetical protein